MSARHRLCLECGWEGYLDDNAEHFCVVDDKCSCGRERDYLRSIVETVHTDAHEALSATNAVSADPNCTCSQKCASDAESAAEQAPGEGGWYSRFDPQPIEIIEKWNLDHWQAEAMTYLVRHDMKGGRTDLEKAIWYIRDLINRKYGDETSSSQ